eukprot:2484367-Rhodomonas_salina.5
MLVMSRTLLAASRTLFATLLLLLLVGCAPPCRTVCQYRSHTQYCMSVPVLRAVLSVQYRAAYAMVVPDME